LGLGRRMPLALGAMVVYRAGFRMGRPLDSTIMRFSEKLY
jgi:hypothetical protein